MKILLLLILITICYSQVPIFQSYYIHLEYNYNNTIFGTRFTPNIKCLVGYKNTSRSINITYVKDYMINIYFEYIQDVETNYIECSNDGINWSQKSYVSVVPDVTSISNNIVYDYTSSIILRGVGFVKNIDLLRVMLIYSDEIYVQRLMYNSDSMVFFYNPKIKYNGEILVRVSNDAQKYSESYVKYTNIYAKSPSKINTTLIISIIIPITILAIILIIILICRMRRKSINSYRYVSYDM